MKVYKNITEWENHTIEVGTFKAVIKFKNNKPEHVIIFEKGIGTYQTRITFDDVELNKKDLTNHPVYQLRELVREISNILNLETLRNA